MNNLIILTTGSSGSSVLAGLISTQGYYLGEETKHLNFNTYENSELVDLNIQLLEHITFKRRDCNDIPPPDVERIRNLHATLDLRPFESFVQKCNQKGPWLWKDPRLAYTIHFWAQFEDVCRADYLFIDRDPCQSYSGLILSRKIMMHFKEQKEMNQNYYKSIEQFIAKQNCQLHSFLFEDLILQPEKFLRRLNKKFQWNIKMSDLKNIYKGNLYRMRYNKSDFLKANLCYYAYKYLKNDYIKFPRSEYE